MMQIQDQISRNFRRRPMRWISPAAISDSPAPSHGKMSGIQGATVRSIRPYKSSEQYLYAMKEDLAEWLKELYSLDIDVGSFLEVLETGTVLCFHANNVTQVAREFYQEYPGLAHKLQLPRSEVTCNESAQPGTFQARDNVSNFIQWCRKEMDIKEVLMFETEDLVLRKNEKNFVLCLLEVARRASRFGMSAPTLIQMEEEIEEEIREEMDLPPEDTPLPKPQRKPCDFKNLDQMVQHLVSRCTCPVQFSMIKVSEGKYRVGDSNTLIFVRILRNHVMVRVGGGWDTLEHYLDKHDPCRCTSLSHKQALKMANPQRLQAMQVQHEIKVCLASKTDNSDKPQPTLIVSRSQSPLPPVEWRTYTSRSLGTSKKLCSSSSPDSASKKTSGLGTPREQSEARRAPSARTRERSATPSRKQLLAEERPPSRQSSSTQCGRGTLHVSMPSQTSQPTGHEQDSPGVSETIAEPQRGRLSGRTPGVHQKERESLAPARYTESKTPKTVLKDSSVQSSKSALHGGKNIPQGHKSQEQGVKNFPGTVRSSSPVKALHPFPQHDTKKATQSHKGQLEGSATHGQRDPGAVRSSSPIKHTGYVQKMEAGTKIPVKAGSPFNRTPTPNKSYQGEPHLSNECKAPASVTAKAPAPYKCRAVFKAEDSCQGHRQCCRVVKPEMSSTSLSTSPGDRASQSDTEGKDKPPCAKSMQEEVAGNTKNSSGSEGVSVGHPGERERVYTPLPIDLAQEQALYRSLEDEILANIKELEAIPAENHHPERSRLDKAPPDCSLASNTAACNLRGWKSATPFLCPLASSRHAFSCGGGVPRSGVYVPSREANWHPAALHYDDVIDELSKGHKTLHQMDVENGIATRPLKQAGEDSPQATSLLMDENQEKKLQGSEGTCLKKDASSEIRDNGSREQPTRHSASADVHRNGTAPQATSNESPTGGPEKSKLPQVKPKRALKKPERVPSIYKLKLRPKIRPRRDNRPEKRPSKIPTPVAHRQAQKAGRAKDQKAHSSKHQSRTSQRSLAGTQKESTENAGSEEEAWLSEQSGSPQAGNSEIKSSLSEGKMWLTEEDEEAWV
ncbi:GAS2-like protein 2 isoform A [Alligator mississippiensis]|uniref:GAS2-like protein 2 isoform A n=1 Tax=Alligator mississippiensis TaxID=8496 RepID=A0A151ML31_ALLMI|nr:GAS2-like protein 2 isoform A [Alligator mississippiensis]